MSIRQNAKKNRMTTKKLRIATRRDFHAFVKLREEWFDIFYKAHPAEEQWCPANVPVPCVEDNVMLLHHLSHEKNERWAAVLASQGKIDGDILCHINEEKSELLIEPHNPRVFTMAFQIASQLLQRVPRRVCDNNNYKLHVTVK